MSPSSIQEELWRRFFRGDHDALPDIVRHCHADLLRRVRHLVARRRLVTRLRTEIDPQDICQRIYLGLWRRRGGRDVNDVGAYLHGIVHNAVRSEIRARLTLRRDLRRNAGRVANLEDLPAAHVAPDREEETRDQLHWLLGQMNRAERTLFELLRAGLDWQEIGRRLEVSPNSARMRFLRATAKIRDVHREDNAP